MVASTYPRAVVRTVALSFTILIAGVASAHAAVTRLTTSQTGAYCVTWSPDSQRLAYYAFPPPTGGPGEVRVVNRDGTGVTTLATNADTGSSACPHWSPDGTRIAYSGYGADGNDDIFVVGRDGSGLTNLSDTPGPDDQPEFSPDGSQILFVSCRDDPTCHGDLYVMPSTGGPVTRLTTDPGVDVEGIWSADGTKIAFTSSRADSAGDVYTMNADGSAQARVTTTSSYDHVPSFMPNGRLLYVKDDAPGTGTAAHLHTIAPDGSGDATLETEPVDHSVNRDTTYSVFAGATKIAFGGAYPAWGVFVAGLDGSHVMQLSQDPAGDFTPVGAPDGSKVVFRSLRDNPNGDLYLTDPTNDADGDGVIDAIDPDGGAGTSPPGSFSDDTGNGKVTTGSVVDPAGLTLTVADVADPKGVRITATGSGGPAVLSVCAAGFELDLPAGTSVTVTCGSVSVSDVQGATVTVKPPGGVSAVTVAPGGSATVDTTADGFTITGVGGTVTLAVAGVSRTLTPGQTVTGHNWRFVGFDQPVDNNGVLNALSAGQTVPLKWRVLNAANQPVTTLTTATVTAQSLTCATTAPVDAIEEFAADASALKNLGNGYYQLNWKTPKTYAASCKAALLDIGDGVTHKALFKLK